MPASSSRDSTPHCCLVETLGALIKRVLDQFVEAWAPATRLEWRDAQIEITGFARFVLGEGVEKKETDFAAEVAAQAGT